MWSRHKLPREHWDERDWRDEWRSQRYQPLNKEPMQPQPLHTAPTWSLTPPKRIGTHARGRRIDKLLHDLGIR